MEICLYSIVLTDGNIVEVKATEVKWHDSSRCVRFICGDRVVGRFNMDNIAGWAEKKYTEVTE